MVCVSVAVSGSKVVGRYYLDERIVYAESCLHLSHNYFLSMLRSLLQVAVFQQNKAPPHYCREVRALLDQTLPALSTGRGPPTRWKCGSLDLTTHDSVLWEYIKNKVHSSHVTNNTPLKRRKTSAICCIRAEVFRNVSKTVDDRLNKVVGQNGGHMVHL